MLFIQSGRKVSGLLFLSLLMASGAALADFKAQVDTAAQHSQFAAKADNVAGVHQHLHHVINCLEGPEGAHFSADAGNPCASKGQGALNEVGNMSSEKALLQQVVSLSVLVEDINDQVPAQKIASAIADLLAAAGSAADDM